MLAKRSMENMHIISFLVFGDKFGDKFSDEFGGKFSDELSDELR